jgi:hypothetical protein
MAREKMSLVDLKKLFPSETGGKYHPLKATKPNYAHVHNPAYKPPKSKITPKVWEEQQKMLKKQLVLERKSKPLLYECPVCKTPMIKLGWCEEDRRWSVLKAA